MSVTDELRKWASGSTLSRWTLKKLIAIADRIDAEHQKAMSRAGQLLADAEKDRDYNYANWQECKQKVLEGNITIDELNARIECLEDALLHCIERPKDADGEDIHIGDVLQWPEDGDTFEVIGIGEDGVLFYFDPDTEGETADWTASQNKRHYHAPTVEDVLRDFASRWDEPMRYGRDELVEQFAAKLQLREDA